MWCGIIMLPNNSNSNTVLCVICFVWFHTNLLHYCCCLRLFTRSIVITVACCWPPDCCSLACQYCSYIYCFFSVLLQDLFWLFNQVYFHFKGNCDYCFIVDLRFFFLFYFSIKILHFYRFVVHTYVYKVKCLMMCATLGHVG